MMKKILKAPIPFFFASTIALPVDVHAIASQQSEDIIEKHKNHSCASDDYSLSLNNGTCGLRQLVEEITGQPETRVLCVTDPRGENVREAQIIASNYWSNWFTVHAKGSPVQGWLSD